MQDIQKQFHQFVFQVLEQCFMKIQPVLSVGGEKQKVRIFYIYIRVDRSEENFPKSILTMDFGCQNA